MLRSVLWGAIRSRPLLPVRTVQHSARPQPDQQPSDDDDAHRQQPGNGQSPSEQHAKHPPPPPSDSRLIVASGPTSFENMADKSRTTYLDLIHLFETKSVQRRNHVEFIYAALRNMEAFGVQRDVEVYKALMNVLPKGKFIPQNMFQAEFMHYPRQQQVIIDLLEQMEDNAVIPDHEMQDILVNTFGRRGHPVLKYWRMLYWMPKFKNASPWLLPDPVPDDAQLLARLAVERMCSVDLQSVVRTFDTADVAGSLDRTWIVSGMSDEQRELLRRHGEQVPLRVDGPFDIWLRNRRVHYFVLRGDASDEIVRRQHNQTNADDDVDDVRNLRFNAFTMRRDPNERSLAIERRSVHVQDDGIVYAICATGTSTKDSLLSWIRLLERDGNEALGRLPILFKFRSPIQGQLAVL